MRPYSVPPAFEDIAAKCQTCKLWEALDRSFVTLCKRRVKYDRQLVLYLQEVRIDPSLDGLFRDASSQYAELIRDAIEDYRRGYDQVISLYYAEDLYGLGNRTRKSVQALFQLWERAQATMDSAAENFTLFRVSLPSQTDNPMANRVHQAFSLLETGHHTMVKRANKFWSDPTDGLHAWLQHRADLTFDVLGELAAATSTSPEHTEHQAG